MRDRQNQRHALPEEIVRWLEDEPATTDVTGAHRHQTGLEPSVLR